MKNKNIEITIPEDVRNKIQRYNVECNAYKDVITSVLTRPDIQISEERFLNYQKEYIEKCFQFAQAKNDLEKEYILPAVNNQKNSWELDYTSCKVIISLIE